LISLLKINVFPSLKGYVVSRIVCVIKTGGVGYLGYNLQFDKNEKTRIYRYIYIYMYRLKINFKVLFITNVSIHLKFPIFFKQGHF